MAQVRILVTGATGFIGRVLVPHLAQQGYAVTALAREGYAESGWPPELTAVRPQIDVVYADLRNFQLTVRAVRDAEPEAVIHLAAVGVADPFLAVDTAVRHNLTGTLNLLRACFEKTFTTRQMIIARTPGELASMNVYAASKAAAWNFCQLYGRTQNWPIHGAMIFQAYGPGQSPRNLIPAAISAARAGQDFPMTAGTQQRDWIYVTDVAAGLAAMLGASLTPGDTVELGSGQTASLLDVVQLIYQLTGRGGRPLPGTLPSRPGEVEIQVANAVHTRERIGWGTAVTLAEGLKQLITDN
ncbi:MAG: SDR family NAD(P)-dependent oxidoreductase [Anaerolineae bacterium]|nr:SDR family NAD(P)-dependent oxidoreductase [Anaerolineae bacterium]